LIEVEIDATPARLMAQRMGLADPTFRGITSLVRKANIPGFDHEPYNPVPKSAEQIYSRIYEEKCKGFTWKKSIAKTKQLILKQLLEELN
jgi:hypothetical protein